jgi:crotonobetainyl-CoA:carnitine CoA-transferase CaiB-like acyl-CoA transferase
VNWHNDINRAKRSIIVDLKTERGKEIFWRLVEDADVILENFRSGVADKLGIGFEAVRARRPGIVYCSINAFGQNGSYSARPGREPVAQAISGMQMRYGGDRPALNPYNANDYGTGMIACFGVAAALFHSMRTGKGQHVQGALIHAATILQSNLLHDYEGKVWNEAKGQDVLGTSPCYRAYQTSDKWIFLAARPADLSRCAELRDLSCVNSEILEESLTARFRKKKASEWMVLLTEADIGAHEIVLKLLDMMDDPLVEAQGLSITREHPEQGHITTTGPAMKMSRTPLVPGNRASMPGADAASILEEIGMRNQLEELVKEKVVVVEGIQPGGPS